MSLFECQNVFSIIVQKDYLFNIVIYLKNIGCVEYRRVYKIGYYHHIIIMRHPFDGERLLLRKEKTFFAVVYKLNIPFHNIAFSD